MPRILHTADWQLGLKARRIPGDRGARVRDVRFRTLHRIRELAHEHGVDAVVVAGDVFDDNQVSGHVLQRTRDALKPFAPTPVLLLPGNHDAAVPGSALERLIDGHPGLDHVHVLLDRTPVTLGDDLVVFPCPLVERHTATDPTAPLPAREEGDTAVRVALAHGGVHGFGDTGPALNRIDAAAVLSKGFDYLALGDWHGLYRHDPRVWYSGAHEATKFEEKDPGKVLIVDLPEAGRAPDVTEAPVATLRWHLRSLTLHGAADLDALDTWLSGLPQRADTLVKLRLSGSLRPSERARLDDLLDRHGDELLHLYVRSDDVVTLLDEDVLASVDAPGFLGEALTTLLEQAEAPGDAGDTATDAAHLLVRLLHSHGAGAAPPEAADDDDASATGGAR